MNCPTNVEPAVIVGLSGLVPYRFVTVGLPLTIGSTINAFGPAPRSSCPSRIPSCCPTSISAALTVSFASANGGRFGKIRPKSALLAGAPPLPWAYPPGDTGEGAPTAAGAVAVRPTDPATNPAPVAPTPFKN